MNNISVNLPKQCVVVPRTSAVKPTREPAGDRVTLGTGSVASPDRLSFFHTPAGVGLGVTAGIGVIAGGTWGGIQVGYATCGSPWGYALMVGSVIVGATILYALSTETEKQAA